MYYDKTSRSSAICRISAAERRIPMAVMDEFKEEREALKNGTPKQKIAYFWYYYKWHVIISVIVIAMAASFIYQYANRKETAFYTVLLNASLLDQMSSDQPDFITDFAEKEGIDPSTSEITFDTSIRIIEDSMDETSVTSSQKLMVYVAANELDSMITDFSSFQKYANSSMFSDLRDILTKEQAQALEPYFYYVDREVVLAIEAANDDMNTDYTPEYPDPLHPEDMQDPVPVGICLTGCKDLTDNYYFRGDGIVMGIYANAEHVQTAVDLAEYLLNKWKVNLV